MCSPARTLVSRHGVRPRSGGGVDGMGDGLRRAHRRLPTDPRAARSLVPERHRGAGEPDERAARTLDLAAPGARAPVAEPGDGARDVHVGVHLPRRRRVAPARRAGTRSAQYRIARDVVSRCVVVSLTICAMAVVAFAAFCSVLTRTVASLFVIVTGNPPKLRLAKKRP